MSKFKSGDRVRVVSYSSDEVTAGSTGVVHESGSLYIAVTLDNDSSGYSPLFKESELEMAYNFKVGDKLKVLKADSLWSGVKEGEIVTVTKFPYEAGYPVDSDGTDYPFGTVQVKRDGRPTKVYVGVTHVAKYDEPKADAFKAGDVVVFRGVERVVKKKCPYIGVDCYILEGSYPNHAPTNEVTPVPTKKPVYNWLEHGTWVLYKGAARQVFRAATDEQGTPEDGEYVSTPLIGHYGSVEDQLKEPEPTRRWAYRNEVVELVPTGPGAVAETVTEGLTEVQPEFEVGKRYSHPERSLEYTVITVEGDKVVVWMDYANASDYDSTTVLDATKRSEYTEV